MINISSTLALILPPVLNWTNAKALYIWLLPEHSGEKSLKHQKHSIASVGGYDPCSIYRPHSQHGKHLMLAMMT